MGGEASGVQATDFFGEHLATVEGVGIVLAHILLFVLLFSVFHLRTKQWLAEDFNYIQQIISS